MLSETTRNVRRALVHNGIEPAGRLRVMASGRTVTDDSSLVAKLEHSPHRSSAYVADLEESHRAGVPAEEFLVHQPLRIGDRWATVVGYVHAVEPTHARHAEAVGRLLRPDPRPRLALHGAARPGRGLLPRRLAAGEHRLFVRHTSVAGLPKTGASTRRTSRRPCPCAMTPQVGQPIGSGADSTVIVKAPPSSRTTPITCSPSRPTSRSQRSQ